MNKLTPEEARVIIDKGTEAPFSGAYENFFQNGVYICRRCQAPLYRSEDKFDAHCGWPSFDAEIPGAVKRSTDADGSRIEISCARCLAHLGHVFTGEKLTPKDTRYCVNSLSMKFIPAKEWANKKETAYLGGGCFWCVEAIFRRIKGVVSVTPGYAGGDKDHPTYQEICSGRTGHVEIVKIEYDPIKISYEAILNIFFTTHDATELNRQGADEGTQYRSIVLFEDENQKEITEKFIKKLEADKIFSRPIVTEIKPLDRFYEAEDYHKNYFEKNPEAAYCQAVISPKVLKLREKFKGLVK